MARILLSLSNAIMDGNAWRPVCFYEQLINALTEEGNDVLLYIPNKFHSCVFGSGNNMFPNVDEDKLVEDIKAFNPELVIAFNNAIYHKILDVTDCRIVVWDADLVPLWSQVDLIKNNLDRYVFFSFVDYYRRKEQEIIGFKDEQSLIVPQGTVMRNTHAEKKTNISFIGTNFGTRFSFIDLIKKHSGEPELLSLLHRIRNDSVFDKDALMRDLTDESLKNDLNAVNDGDIPYFFPGEERLRILLALSDLGLNLYAQGDWIAQALVLPSLAACDTRQTVYSLADNERIYNQSKICVNINHKTQAAHGMSWRIPDIMATGGCLVSSYSPAIKEKFKNYVDIPMFDNEYDARTLCQKILNDEKWRADIVAGSNAAIEKEGRWTHSLKKAEDFLNIKLTDLGKKGSLTVLEPVFLISEKIVSFSGSKISWKNKIRYKLWKHLNKKETASLWEYKIHKHLSKKLVKKGIIPSYTPLSRGK